MGPSLSFAGSFHGRLAGLALLVVGIGVLAGCSKKIGDPCNLSADCGISNNRQCDTAQLGGYCTQIGCTANGCPSEAACFLFGPRIGGCSYDDREAARTSRSFCMHSCDSDHDCRDGYVRADVTKEPWTAVLIDTEEIKPKACIVPATFATGGTTEAAEPAVCAPTGADAAIPASEDDTEDSDAGSDDDASADDDDASVDAAP